MYVRGYLQGSENDRVVTIDSDAVSFRDIRGHLGTIPSIVTFYICACRRRALGDYSRVTRRNPGE